MAASLRYSFQQCTVLLEKTVFLLSILKLSSWNLWLMPLLWNSTSWYCEEFGSIIFETPPPVVVNWSLSNWKSSSLNPSSQIMWYNLLSILVHVVLLFLKSPSELKIEHSLQGPASPVKYSKLKNSFSFPPSFWLHYNSVYDLHLRMREKFSVRLL